MNEIIKISVDVRLGITKINRFGEHEPREDTTENSEGVRDQTVGRPLYPWTRDICMLAKVFAFPSYGERGCWAATSGAC